MKSHGVKAYIFRISSTKITVTQQKIQINVQSVMKLFQIYIGSSITCC